MHITELAPNLLVLSACEPVDGRVSWVPPGATGFEPYNVFLLRTADRALLVDTGVAKHGPALLAALPGLAGARRLFVYASRIELDTLGNLAAVLASFPEAGVVTANPISPLELIHLPPGCTWHGGPVVHLRLNEDLGAVGFPHLVALEPVLRTLGTSWLYDREGGTLFTSDSFGGEMLGAPDMPVIRRDDMRHLPDAARLRAHLLAKFDWLAQADVGGLAAHWDRLFGSIAPGALAPLHGRVQAGRDLVAEMLARYRAAMLGPARA